MFKIALTLALSLWLAGQANAQSRTVYDWQTGNTYRITPNYNGGATVQGYNFNNGTSGRTEIDRRGNQRGYDAQGGYWQYNNRTGSYFNYQTGRSCYGKGLARFCD